MKKCLVEWYVSEADHIDFTAGECRQHVMAAALPAHAVALPGQQRTCPKVHVIHRVRWSTVQ